MMKVLLLRQISRATKAHHLVFLVFALFWCSGKETYPQDAHQQLQAGYPSPSEHTRSYLFSSWDGKRDELAAKRHHLRLFFTLRTYKQILLEAFGKRRLAGVAFAARWI
jgi:hypothetical protein